MEPLEAFFRQYAWFRYKKNESAEAQYNRLRKEAGWKRGDPEGDKAWEDYRTALVRQFNTSFSNDDNDLDTWNALLRHVGINNPPGTVKECKDLIGGKFINLIDLINARDNPGVIITHYRNEVELSKYTLNSGKIFPRDHVEAGSLLRYLLRHIEHPDPNRRDPSHATQGPGKKKGGRR
ncbi:hypothetical protein P691DRAFT_680946 [Macrolepiota fuliginosa MF-IS2]|uniref:Uncharacterized protein n=1 Tax=Macrolepiota fuliginosa MF-IS2 TaxID=1400762 RepID=A0A9P5X4I3_9AGAR|nr:hypothetical protein P691DRAFT_680946 [Macrolepiota fuliginosa MF-IS2]